MNRNAHVLLRVLAYIGGVLLIACVASPWLYWAGSHLAHEGVLPFLKGFPFQRYFSRTAQIAALVLLIPAFRWVGVKRLAELGIQKNPNRLRDLGAGFGIALLPVILMGVAFVALEIYRFRSDPSPSRIGRIFLTAGAVSVIEEFLFRGVLLGLCLRSMPAVLAAGVSSGVFALVHFMRVAKPAGEQVVHWWSGFAQLPQLFSSAPPWPLLGWGIASLFVAGLILCHAAIHTRSLWLPVGIHAAWITGQQGLQWACRLTNKAGSLPWVGTNVVSGAVPTGIIPLGVLLLTWAAVAAYLRLRGGRA